MRFQFIEIGTSDFDTILQQSKRDDIIGIAIEPIKLYLDNLPNKPNVLKINAAISNYNGSADVFYIHPSKITQYNLPSYLKGCNSIHKMHPTTKHLIEKSKLNISDLFTIEEIPVYKISYIFNKYNVSGCDLLRVDTEGHDIIILNDMFDSFDKQEISFLPLKIKFESNVLTDPNDIDIFLNRAYIYGYKLLYRNHDTVIFM